MMDLSKNSFNTIDSELEGDSDDDAPSPRGFCEENAFRVSTGDVEFNSPEFIIAEKENEGMLIDFKTEEEKDDLFSESMLDFPAADVNASQVLLVEDGNEKTDLLGTDRENEEKKDDPIQESTLGFPIVDVNVSPVPIYDDGNEKTDLLVTDRENEEEKDDLFHKSMLDFPTADVNASQVLLYEDGYEKMDLLVTDRESEEQKKDDLFHQSMLDFPTADVNASQVLLYEDGYENTDLLVTDRENEDQKKDDLADISMPEFSTSEPLEEKEREREPFVKIETSNVSEKVTIDDDREELNSESSDEFDESEPVFDGTELLPGMEASKNFVDGNGKMDFIVSERENEDDLAHKSMPNFSTTEPSQEKFETSNVSEKVYIADDSKELSSENSDEVNESEPVFDGTELQSTHSLDPDSESQGSWPEKAVAIKNFVREKSAVAVSTVVRRLSGKSDDDDDEKFKDENSESVSVSPNPNECEFQKTGWNPLSLIGISRVENKAEVDEEVTEESLLPIPMKGRILLYTRLGCKECQKARTFLHRKKLTYVEINIDVYPSRKLELEKISGSNSVPRVFFNEILVGGMSEMKSLDEVGKLKDKIEYVVTEAPPYEAPLPPLSGEDDMSTFGSMDELALIVRKMKETILVKDRFYKMRRFTSCFLGSEAVDFLSEDQYLERKDAVEFGRKLASGLFFQHVLEENVFEDGNHLYRFMDQDPIVISQCYNIPRGITEVKPKPITEISSRLRFLSYAIFEAYTSEDGKHVDYRSIHGSEEFARYLRIIEELQRVDLNDMPREEKLSFFINLFNMMVIHAILILGYPSGALERRKMLGDFKYIIGGCSYSLSAIQNGILRGNQRPPYNLTKPFGLKDKRAKVALPYPEPLIHFALVFGNRSGPPLRCFSAGEVDKELMEVARNFLRSGGLIADLNNKVTSVTKILKWYSVDFGKNEVEVLKHAANYLGPVESEAMLELLATTQMKVVYQPYDWGMNN